MLNRSGDAAAEKRTSRIPVFGRAGGRKPRKEPTLSRKPSVKTPSVPDEPATPSEPPILARVLSSLEDDKAEDIATIHLTGRSSLADAIVVATGRSARHVASLAENMARRLKEAGYAKAHIEGLPQGDWVLVDTGDVIVHLFRDEVRAYYDLESMWAVAEKTAGEEKKNGRRGTERAGSAA